MLRSMDSGLAASRRPGMTRCAWGHAVQQILIQLSNSPTQTCVIARCNWVPGHPSVQRHFTTPLKMGAVRREVGYGHCPRCRDADPHPAWNLAADRRSAHRAGTIRGSFSEIRILPTRRGRTNATCSVVCATKLARWGSCGAIPAFRLSPALAGLRLLPRDPETWF